MAEEKAKEEGADLLEIRTKKPYSFFSSYLKGAPLAKVQGEDEIEPINCDFSAYDKIILAAPIWNGFPAPAFNSLTKLLPAKTKVELIFTAGGGNTRDKGKIRQKLEDQGLEVLDMTVTRVKRKKRS